MPCRYGKKILTSFIGKIRKSELVIICELIDQYNVCRGTGIVNSNLCLGKSNGDAILETF